MRKSSPSWFPLQLFVLAGQNGSLSHGVDGAVPTPAHHPRSVQVGRHAPTGRVGRGGERAEFRLLRRQRRAASKKFPASALLEVISGNEIDLWIKESINRLQEIYHL